NTDREKLRVILDNLFSNAIKFTEEHSRVQVQTGQFEDQIYVEVQDQGPGIPPADRERVFEVFYQGNEQPRGHVRGSGMGLSIAREYAKALDGHLEVMEVASGACVRLLLPRLRMIPPEAPDETPTQGGTAP
ncbi:MAG: sensor histidine kinase, partial [Thioalkalivibrio sp.]